MRKIVFFILLTSSSCLHGQELSDTLQTLDAIVVKAFAYDRPLRDVPAAIAQISSADLSRFSNTNFLPAFNAQPGVRMEERSPGSYRLSIRGSTLRSPFGIRNVKVYWNGIPLTDNGGNTYLNLLDFNSVDNLEIIKGPGSSLYGAGTGGVLLLNQSQGQSNLSANIQGGSNGLLRFRVGAEQSMTKLKVGLNYSHQEANGYRDHSAMKRDVLGLHSKISVGNRSSVLVNFLHSDLYYQTPGALTKIQYDTLPTMARPGGASKKAAIYNETFFGGLTFGHDWSRNWTSNLSLFGNATNFENPAILNYEKRNERSFGMRMENHWTGEKGKFTVGGEIQTGRSLISVGDNNQGDYVERNNGVRLPTNLFFLFTQYDWTLPMGFYLTTGISVNQLNLKFDTLGSSGYVNANQRKLGYILSPRVALLKKLSPTWSAYASYSRGYSPPTTAEVFPSLSIYNPTLKPEDGDNFETGIKGAWRWLKMSATFYSFQLRQTIIKLDSAGSDYFTNSGRTNQNGVEILLQFQITKSLSGWSSYSLNDYRFKNYVQDANNFSGNSLTGSAPHVMSVGLDYTIRNFYANITANYVDQIPLNDANTVYADQYFLLGFRIGYRTKNILPIDFFGGVDNLLSEKYSLGNDLNAFGGRYFNAAPTRNYFVGLNLKLRKLKRAS